MDFSKFDKQLEWEMRKLARASEKDKAKADRGNAVKRFKDRRTTAQILSGDKAVYVEVKGE